MVVIMHTEQDSSRNLGQDGQKAFHALINSLVPTASQRNDKLTPEAVDKVSEKLKELVGNEAEKEFTHRRNESGELVNEEGLPIIEISEPLSQPEEAESQEKPVVPDIPLIKFSSLPSIAREKLRQQRERILDALEEEERRDNERQERVEMEEREELLRKRREEALNDEARIQKAKELQKKMGKALMRNLKSSEREADTPPKEELDLENHADFPATKSEAHKKTVTFVEPDNLVSTRSEAEWDNVTAARLRSDQRSTLLRAFHPGANPVKLNVVERRPTAGSSAPPTFDRPLLFAESAKDSDDESEPESVDLHPASDSDENDEVLAEELPDSEDDGEVELENEYDLDYAQHQREIALEYYNKRNTTGQDAAKAMMEGIHKEQFDIVSHCQAEQIHRNGLDSSFSEKESVSEPSASNTQSKPSVSRFKVNRLASMYSTSTRANSSTSPTSIGKSFLPESSTRTIQRSIRSGRIDDNGYLVGGDHDTDSEIEAEGLQEALELLKKGEVYNPGPVGQYLFTTPEPQFNNAAFANSATGEDSRTHTSAALSSGPVAQQQGLQHGSLPPLNRPKSSKFKADRSQSGRRAAISRSESHAPDSSVSQAILSSPKFPSTPPDRVLEELRRKSHTANALEAPQPSHLPPTSSSLMIIDSPSFRAPGTSQIRASSSTSMVIESPSFSNQSTGTLVQKQDIAASAFPPSSLMLDSPSFPSTGKRSRRPDQPPVVVSSQNLTCKPAATPENTRAHTPPSTCAPTESHSILSTTVLERVPPVPKGNTRGNDLNTTSSKASRFKQSRSTQS